ncbi:xanthine dehydrogenase family protein molybdopterin-binding subunit [Bosea sp. (in: a-proteobacteria)]|uniref:xanthine dehydrogenase family protein molybdopterin-binding subunit n=1 Tax=Bosea sp. (in: a-proteobacteria) TaxID=1871050 RepID=UPI002639A462|nr:xanthine dehydrogenase family protein molybdopterin-binding subunit [Bosea sp. (in: a-proteobacteria)]MCO5091209.1 xanthine dehydrogenase family protein molybdopterin-binding subunit [Bosea sp. (in: a-proteobacteria)]
MRVSQAEHPARRAGIGQSLPRNEDAVLLRGEGRYTDDLSLEGQLHAAFVRSPHAHGVIRGIDTAAAAAMKGVVAIYTAADLEGQGYGLLKCQVDLPSRGGSAMKRPERKALATGKVRFVGDPVAMVVARTALQARDAAEAVALDIDILPAVTSVEAALAPGAPQLFDDVPGNLILDYHFGDAEKVAAAFAGAAHVTRVRIVNNRIIVNPMEPRAAIADYDRKAKRYTLHAPSQGAFGMRNNLAAAMGVPQERMHLLTGHVGGSFGMKAAVFPEYIVLLHAARLLKKPVKWTDQRSESFVSDHHGRDMVFEAELALDARGRFLATRFTGFGNMGGYLSPPGPMMATLNIGKNSVGMYRTPLIEVQTRCAVTNTVPIAAYRGAGRPEGNYLMERLIDTAAREMGIDRAVIRRRNLIGPRQLPWKTPIGTVYDSGDFPALFARALAAADWKGYPARERSSRKAGKLRGRGIGCYLEVTAPPGNEMGGIHFEPDGTVTIVTGTLDYGQGHWTPFAQVLTSRLGVPFDRIRLVQGDSDRLIAGGGTGGSKSIMASGSAIIEASERVIEKGRLLSAHLLEAAVADIEFADGRFRIAGTDRSIGIMELAESLRAGAGLPGDLPRTLDVDHVFKAAPPAYPNGCHIAEVEIDPETGRVEIARYVMVNDFGVLVNPMIVEGQLHGGVVQGIGQALCEMTTYDEAGQLITGSYMDYAMPRAADVPFFSFISQGVPTRLNPVGAKGCGEAGCAGSLPSVMNALVDALAPHGVRHIDMPATPQAIWRAIHARA